MEIFIYANCQGRAFPHLLPLITDRHLKISHIANYQAIDGEIPHENMIELARTADIFIYQPVGPEHRHWSSESVISYLKPSCKQISFPYIYNNALWPVFDLGGTVFHNRDVILKYVKEGVPTHEITRLYLNGGIDFNYLDRYQETMDIFKSKELDTDIKLTKYLDENFREFNLMLGVNHPSTRYLLHLVESVLDALGWSNSEVHAKVEALASTLHRNIVRLEPTSPIDASALKAFGFKFLDQPEPNSAEHYLDCFDQIIKRYHTDL